MPSHRYRQYMPLDFLPIPGGGLELRDARTGSQRAVTLVPFELGRAPVTKAEFDASREADDSATRDIPAHPITWFEAIDWCIAASHDAGLEPAYAREGRAVLWNPSADGYRLPTEAEWEHACRAGTTTPGYGSLADIAWTAADETGGAQPVGRKHPNAFGLFDTLGNVWEWCWDYADPARYADYRVLRGGGWADQAWSVRASVRRGSAPDAVIEDVGFRVARGAVAEAGATGAQGWSAEADADRVRAALSRPLPMGWTPLR